MRIQPTNHNPTIGEQNELRENTMFVSHEETKGMVVGAASAAIGGLMLAASLLLAPSTALADNECGADAPDVNGALADSYDCPDADYAEGVTYAADGDLTVNFTNTDSPARSIIGENADNGDDPTDMGGIDLSATGGDGIIFDSATTGTEIQSDGVIGALLSVTTVDGSIAIDAAQVDADTFTSSDVTHGIFAESTGTGSIDITTTGNVDAASDTNPADSIGIEAITGSGFINITTGGNVSGNRTGIRAVSTSGDMTLTTNDNVSGDEFAIQALSSSGDVTVTTNDNLSADEFGIQASTGGAGALTLDINANVILSLAGQAIAAIDATTGTGLLSIDVDGPVDGREGSGIRTNANGDVVIDVASDSRVVASNGRAMDLTAAGETTVNNAGRISVTTSSGADSLAIRATGGTFVLNNIGGVDDNEGRINGPIDFSGLTTGGYVFNNTANAIWNIGTGLATGNAFLATKPRVSTLGAGTFNNAGTILFGENKEVILAQGTSYNGMDAVMEMPVRADDLTAAGQTGCTPDTVTAAGCLNLAGGETSGQTSILITTPTPQVETDKDLLGAANPGILLVDVSGGTSAAGHFVLHEDSENYLETSFYGPVLTTGEPAPLVYTLLYNPDNQQHVLGTVPTEEGAEYATFIDEALSIWHTTADTVVGRQADLRDGATGGGWVRLVSERTTRDAGLAMTTHGNDFTFDMGYERDTRAALFGFDVMARENYVIGLHGGLISSDTDYDGTGNGNETKGAAAGVYGGWWRDLGIGQLTVDAAVNGNFLRLSHDASYEVTHSDVRSFGVRAEAGWRLPVIDGFYLQPLATAAYVTTNIERLELRLNDITFEDSESQRAALGLRLGGDFEVQNGLIARYWLTGRAWNESAEEGRVEYATPGEPLTIADDLSGSFEEVGFGASLSNKEDNLSVYASAGTQDRDDTTDNYNVSVGLRKRW